MAENPQDQHQELDDSSSTSRRDALKKAALGGAAAAAVWSAPKIEGLSVVPDYASAGTNTTPVITIRLNGNGPGLLGGNNFMNVAPSPAYTVVQNGPSDNQTIQVQVPLGPAGNATYTLPPGQDTDGSDAISQTVTFDVDPPFNKCQVLGGTADWDGSTSDRGQTTYPGGNNQVPNTTSPRTVNVPIGPGAPSAGNNTYNPVTKLNWTEIRIQCT